MARITRGGVGLHYEDHARGPAPLLTHGYGATSANWAPLIRGLTDRFRVVVRDVRGHGESDAPGDPGLCSEAESIADMAANLDAPEAFAAAVADFVASLPPESDEERRGRSPARRRVSGLLRSVAGGPP